MITTPIPVTAAVLQAWSHIKSNCNDSVEPADWKRMRLFGDRYGDWMVSVSSLGNLMVDKVDTEGKRWLLFDICVLNWTAFDQLFTWDAIPDADRGLWIAAILYWIVSDCWKRSHKLWLLYADDSLCDGSALVPCYYRMEKIGGNKMKRIGLEPWRSWGCCLVKDVKDADVPSVVIGLGWGVADIRSVKVGLSAGQIAIEVRCVDMDCAGVKKWVEEGGWGTVEVRIGMD